MRIFLTGATGFVGSAVLRELADHGHRVLGLARSEQSAAKLGKAGIDVLRGDLNDLETLRRGAHECDAVIHAGYNTAFSENDDAAKQRQNAEKDGQAIRAIGETLQGTSRPFIVTSGTALVAPGRLAYETDRPVFTPEQFPRVLTEQAADMVAAQGVNIGVVRLSPTVHGKGDHGFIPLLIDIAREKGVSAYIGNGENCWSAVHRLDAAKLYRLALANRTPGARLHAAADSRIPFREIASAIGRSLGVPTVSISPDEASGHFGWFRHFAELDAPVSSEQTRKQFGWNPSNPFLLDDLREGGYFD
ncbi:SDR family oxidoreductase [Saccharibacillus sp. CPCC 101409]|uniref:SDR family oxidoreductase n=1 Tax=Saccharibacillus sp. CPCC 101409 TaxID=3058041 RepID=UPI0026735031|nr:SDR family oxidoreductase [Saccharibacillus sp. CPCC 101409]MDO3411232.1 SDR family oxidoreductase [Saccharibacillus sp. CPCC 101409]